MDKAVLMSIKPYWVFLIIAKAMGWNIGKEKTIEVRKNYPKDENWDKVVKIYCSKDKKSFAKIPKEYKPLMQKLLGKVTGEFVCDGISGNLVGYRRGVEGYWGLKDGTCLRMNELMNYGRWKTLYGWHISDLVIYDKPKELSGFVRICPEWEKEEITDKCLNCEHRFINRADYFVCCDCEGELPIRRPPQSWCYVENHSSSF